MENTVIYFIVIPFLSSFLIKMHSTLYALAIFFWPGPIYVRLLGIVLLLSRIKTTKEVEY